MEGFECFDNYEMTFVAVTKRCSRSPMSVGEGCGSGGWCGREGDGAVHEIQELKLVWRD